MYGIEGEAWITSFIRHLFNDNTDRTAHGTSMKKCINCAPVVDQEYTDKQGNNFDAGKFLWFASLSPRKQYNP